MLENQTIQASKTITSADLTDRLIANNKRANEVDMDLFHVTEFISECEGNVPTLCLLQQAALEAELSALSIQRIYLEEWQKEVIHDERERHQLQAFMGENVQ